MPLGAAFGAIALLYPLINGYEGYFGPNRAPNGPNGDPNDHNGAKNGPK